MTRHKLGFLHIEPLVEKSKTDFFFFSAPILKTSKYRISTRTFYKFRLILFPENFRKICIFSSKVSPEKGFYEIWLENNAFSTAFEIRAVDFSTVSIKFSRMTETSRERFSRSTKTNFGGYEPPFFFFFFLTSLQPPFASLSRENKISIYQKNKVFKSRNLLILIFLFFLRSFFLELSL